MCNLFFLFLFFFSFHFENLYPSTFLLRVTPLFSHVMWSGEKIFRPESVVKVFILEIGVEYLSGMFNLVPEVKFF